MNKRYNPLKRDLFKHVKRGLITGKFVPVSKGEIEKIVDNHYLNFNPLNPLTEQEQTELRKRLIRGIDCYINEGFDRLCRKDHSIISYTSAGTYVRGGNGHKVGDTWEEPRTRVVSPDNLEYELDQIKKHGKPKDGKINVRPWTYEEKIQDMTDPEIWTDNYSGSSIRHLDVYMKDNFFRTMMNYARQGLHFEGDKIVETPKQKIKILEIGTGTGRALTDMKKIDQNIETHGINFAPEFTMYPGHQYHFMSLERMPEEFEENFDYVHSHQCFRYSAYPDAGYANILRALSVGGIAWLDLSIDKNPLGYEEGAKRKGKMIETCNKLIKDGFIRTISNPPTMEEIVKLKSIPKDYDLRK